MREKEIIDQTHLPITVKGIVRDLSDLGVGKVGNAECALFDMREAVDFTSKWLMKHRL